MAALTTELRRRGPGSRPQGRIGRRAEEDAPTRMSMVTAYFGQWISGGGRI